MVLILSLFNETLNTGVGPVSCGNVTKIVPNFEVPFFWLLSETVTHQPIPSPHQIPCNYRVFIQLLRKLCYNMTTRSPPRRAATQAAEKLAAHGGQPSQEGKRICFNSWRWGGSEKVHPHLYRVQSNPLGCLEHAVGCLAATDYKAALITSEIPKMQAACKVQGASCIVFLITKFLCAPLASSLGCIPGVSCVQEGAGQREASPSSLKFMLLYSAI